MSTSTRLQTVVAMGSASRLNSAIRNPKSEIKAAFHDAAREQQSFLAPAERRCLHWLATRMPAWVNPDHLTLLGFAAMMAAGACYALARWWPPALLLVNVCLALNWFGDSLDGTLARVRSQLRPRYGFYVDHMADAFGSLFLLGGLAASGYMSERLSAALLVAYCILSINVYLATYALGTFKLSFWKFSPTELRILIAVGNLVALVRPRVFGARWLFYDVAGVVGICALAVLIVVSVARNTITLYRQETVGGRQGAVGSRQWAVGSRQLAVSRKQ